MRIGGETVERGWRKGR